MALALSSLHDQAQRQLVTHWRVRVQQVLDHLQNEVQRMLQLEATLEIFATGFASRMDSYRQQKLVLPEAQAARIPLPSAPFEWAAQHIGAARASECKRRFRQLARELHPDFAGTDNDQPRMHAINDAYTKGDLAALVRCEAQSLAPDVTQPTRAFEDYVRQVEQAAQTYRHAYTQLLNSPLYSLYARAASAQEDGWDFTASLARKCQQALMQLARAA